MLGLRLSDAAHRAMLASESRFAHRYDLGITWFDIEFTNHLSLLRVRASAPLAPPSGRRSRLVWSSLLPQDQFFRSLRPHRSRIERAALLLHKSRFGPSFSANC